MWGGYRNELTKRRQDSRRTNCSNNEKPTQINPLTPPRPVENGIRWYSPHRTSGTIRPERSSSGRTRSAAAARI